MLNNQPAQKLKVILHAPTGNALQRARNNARNLKKATPDAEIRIIVNAEAVTTALDTVEADTDMMTWVCPNTLAKLNRELRPLLLYCKTLQFLNWFSCSNPAGLTSGHKKGQNSVPHCP